YEMRSYVGVPPKGEISRETQLDLLQAYAACVSYVDAQIGRLLAEVDLDKTVVILWSDHGWHLGEMSAWGKMTNFEIATRVPLIFAGPGVESGRTKSLTELVDLYPTICEIAGIDSPDHVEGESVSPILENSALPEKNGIARSQYARFGTRFMGYAIRTDRYRYVAWKEKKTGRIVARELYDHDSDPDDMENLAEDPAYTETVHRLEKRMNRVGLEN
ncbi:MAG: sulfatase-like hydrolase/transferase, partial [Verrucomicrobiales bacterium]|nr:sulfatase-like hydrolase/transferase [Verrucomicrobiales bacterium]